MSVEEIAVPEVGESVTEGTIASWYVEVGSMVRAGDALFELSTEKVDSEIPSPRSGTIVSILAPAGSAVQIGDAVATIEVSASEAPREAGLAPAAPPAPPRAPTSPDIGASSQTPGTPGRSNGSGALLPPMPAGRARAGGSPESMGQAIGASGGGSFVPYSRVRAVTARLMAEAAASIPQAMSVVEVDHSAIMDARTTRRRRGDELVPTPLAFQAVCVVRALRDHPELNASVGDSGIIQHSQINLAIAVDTPEGLYAPVIKDAGKFTVVGLAAAIADLADRARSGTLAPDDVMGATFTVSNNGSAGSVLTMPVITPPQVAVVSTDRIVARPVALDIDGEVGIGIRPMGNLAMTWDHRAIDGAKAASFLVRIKEIAEMTDWSSVG